MKSLLSLLLCVSVACAFAQTPEAKSPLRSPQYFEILVNGQKKKFPIDSSLTVVPDRQLFLSNAKPGIHRLPIDNMPCVMPNTTGIAHIPNAFQGTVRVPFSGRIPNAAKPRTSPNVFMPRLKQIVPPTTK